MKKTDWVITVILIVGIITVAVMIRFNPNNNYENELIDIINKRFDSLENQIYQKIDTVDKRIYEIEKTDQLVSDKIENVYESLEKIKNNQKQIRNEKIKQDQEIINASDSSDWDWFNRRFPK